MSSFGRCGSWPIGGDCSPPDRTGIDSWASTGGRNMAKAAKVARQLSRPYRVDDGRKFRLKEVDPDDTKGLESKEKGREYRPSGIERLCTLQDKLYAQDRRAVLLVFQAMDAAGKDGTIKHV